MKQSSTDKDEIQLAKVTKSLLAMPTKSRDDSKFGKLKKKSKSKTSKATRP